MVRLEPEQRMTKLKSKQSFKEAGYLGNTNSDKQADESSAVDKRPKAISCHAT